VKKSKHKNEVARTHSLSTGLTHNVHSSFFAAAAQLSLFNVAFLSHAFYKYGGVHYKSKR